MTSYLKEQSDFFKKTILTSPFVGKLTVYAVRETAVSIHRCFAVKLMRH